jgi:hypothetical protein
VDEEVANQIFQYEMQLLQHTTRKSQSQLAKLLADDFVEFGSSGRIFTKKDIIEKLPLEEEITFKLTNFQAKYIEENVVLTTFEIEKNSGVNHTLRSSIWKCYNRQWRMIFHQGTPKKLHNT